MLYSPSLSDSKDDDPLSVFQVYQQDIRNQLPDVKKNTDNTDPLNVMSDVDLKQRDLLADTLDIWRESRAPLSVDGEKLTCRFQRREHRFTDVYENLVSKTMTSSARMTSV